MATRGTGKSWEEILAAQKAEAEKTYNEESARVNATTAQAVEQQRSIIDKAAADTTSQYEQRIAEAPKKFAGQYDENLIDELVGRKNLEKTMADMGLTDSGLNRSQQTSLSVMRGNADAGTRRQQRDYITAAEQAIDQVLAQAEMDKATYENAANAKKDQTLDQLYASLQQNANTNAANIYKAQEESLSADYKARLEAETKAAEAGEKLTSQITTFALKRMQDDPTLTLADAMTEAKIVYGVADKNDQLTYEGKSRGYIGSELKDYVGAGGGEAGDKAVHNNSAKRATEVVSSINVKVDRFGWESAEKLGEKISANVIKKLEKAPEYTSLGETSQNYVSTYAVAKCVAESCEGMTENKILEVLYSACENVPGADSATAKEYLYSIWKPNKAGAFMMHARR